MKQSPLHVRAEAAFDSQSGRFDDLYGTDDIVLYKRARVRQHLTRHLKPRSHILELNAGTGEDAVFLVRQGHRVHATDISAGMLSVLEAKAQRLGLPQRLTWERCDFTRLELLENAGPYDYILSNLAGLNCTPHLDRVLDRLPGLLHPGGMATLVVLPPVCLWELSLIFRGHWRTATRRLWARRGRLARVEGRAFPCWYYRPRAVIRLGRPGLTLVDAEGLCTLVPPAYLQGFAAKHPRGFHWLQRAESRLKSRWPWKYCGDYVILSFRKSP